MALAGDQQHVAGFQLGNAGADRLGAVADFGRACCRGQNSGADRGRALAARIVVGDDDAVGILLRDAAHDRPLAGIAVATGAEHHHQSAGGIGPQRLQRFRQRVRLVGVVDKYRGAVPGADQLQPPFGAGEL